MMWLGPGNFQDNLVKSFVTKVTSFIFDDNLIKFNQS